MNTSISPEAQALLDAALRLSGQIDSRPTEQSSEPEHELAKAASAYRATLAPKECRPPAGAKDGDLFWLVNPNEKIVGEWVDNGWRLPGTEVTARDAVEDGWTVHSPCTFPGERVEATETEMVEAVAAALNPNLFSADRQIAHFAASPFDLEAARAAARLVAKAAVDALRHFSPTLRPVSDETTDEASPLFVDDDGTFLSSIMRDVSDEKILELWQDVCGKFNPVDRPRALARAVLSYAQGEGE